MRKPREFETHPVKYWDAFSKGFYRGYCRYDVDGDTFDAFIDLGFRHYAYLPIRIEGYWAAETFHPKTPQEREIGLKAKETLQSLILENHILLRAKKDVTSFERFVAEVFLPDYRSVADLMKQLVPEWDHLVRKNQF